MRWSGRRCKTAIPSLSRLAAPVRGGFSIVTSNCAPALPHKDLPAVYLVRAGANLLPGKTGTPYHFRVPSRETGHPSGRRLFMSLPGTARMKSVDEIPIDKLGLLHYLSNYEKYIGPIRTQPLKFLELGVARGDSLKYWESWLPNAEITGLDIAQCPAHFESGRVRCYVREQQDKALLDRVAAERAPKGFDVIIDDAAHVGQLAPI